LTKTKNGFSPVVDCVAWAVTILYFEDLRLCMLLAHCANIFPIEHLLRCSLDNEGNPAAV